VIAPTDIQLASTAQTRQVQLGLSNPVTPTPQPRMLTLPMHSNPTQMGDGQQTQYETLISHTAPVFLDRVAGDSESPRKS
jgi:hypothetical protein